MLCNIFAIRDLAKIATVHLNDHHRSAARDRVIKPRVGGGRSTGVLAIESATHKITRLASMLNRQPIPGIGAKRHRHLEAVRPRRVKQRGIHWTRTQNERANSPLGPLKVCRCFRKPLPTIICLGLTPSSSWIPDRAQEKS
jgi:hypothetical protein